MKFFWKVLQCASDGLRVVGLACLVGMMLLTCVDVIGRKFGHPVFGSVELVGFMATLAAAFALPYTHQAKAHIGWRSWSRRFPEPGPSSSCAPTS